MVPHLDFTLMAESEEEIKGLWMKVKEESDRIEVMVVFCSF